MMGMSEYTLDVPVIKERHVRHHGTFSTKYTRNPTARVSAAADASTLVQ